MRLIDADKLRKDIQFVLDTLGEPANHGLRQSMSIIDKTPTVDAEPVIRCEECKYFKFGNGCFVQSVDYDWEEQMGANDFCSRGEPK